MVESLSIVGAGRVGRALGRRLRELGWKIGVVCASSESSARKAVRFIGAGRPQAGLTVQVLTSRVVLLTVPDDAIPAVASELARIGGDEWRGLIVLHTSGRWIPGALAAEIVRRRSGLDASATVVQRNRGSATRRESFWN